MSQSLESLGLNRNTRLRSRNARRGKYAALLVECPPGWRPHSPASLPPAIVSARYMVRHCRCLEAAAISQGYNTGHLNEHFGGEWALVASSGYGVVPEGEHGES